MPSSPENNTRLVDTPEKQVSFSNWPELIREALGHLVDTANNAGSRTGLGELSAALVFDATLRYESEDDLADVIMQYRKAKVSDLQTPEE